MTIRLSTHRCAAVPGRGRSCERQLPGRPRRAEPADVRQRLVAVAEAQAGPLPRAVGLREAPRPAGRGRLLHGARPRAQAGRARHVHGAPRLLQRQGPLLEEEGLPRAERQGLHEGVPRVRQGVPVGQDLLGLERDQPQVPADVQEPERRPPATTTCCASTRARRSSARWRPTCSTRATWPATCARFKRTAKGTPEAVGPAQLRRRQPPPHDVHEADAAQRARARCG